MFGGSKSTKHQESEILGLTDSARKSAIVHRDAQRAVELQGEAAALTRELTAKYPGDMRHAQSLGAILYSLGAYLTTAQQPEEAVKVLNECEQVYLNLQETSSRIDVLLADVAARRGVAHAVLGKGASAVVDLQSAVQSYHARGSSEPTDPHYFDFARVLAINADVLRAFGDPDLAVASADWAIVLYVNESARANRSVDAALHPLYLRRAVDVAVMIHKANGREDVARTASEIGQRTGGLLSLETLASRADSLSLTLTLTVARALERAAQLLGHERVEDELIEVCTPQRELVNQNFFPLQRSNATPEVFAQTLAELAIDLLALDPKPGMRLGLEAHYIFAGASRLQTLPMRYQFSDFGIPWARVLLACSRQMVTEGNRVMAMDLAAWAGGVAGQLSPFIAMSSEIQTLAQACAQHYRQLLTGNGQPEA
jgi:tetratricopeptide (TPR) repeat protein